MTRWTFEEVQDLYARAEKAEKERDEARASCAVMCEALKEASTFTWQPTQHTAPSTDAVRLRVEKALGADIGKREAERIAKLERLVSMLASAVKSGEPWSEVLEREMGGVGCAFTSTNSR